MTKADGHLTRRERRAAGAGSAPLKAADMPLEQPDRSGPKAPTLYDLAAEREKELSAQAASRNAPTASVDPGDEAPLLLALLYGTTLTSLSLTLDILVWHQYAQNFSYRVLVTRNLSTTLPILIALVYIFHSPFFGLARVPLLRQGIFFATAVVAGAYATWLSNDASYLAVVKKAPPAGTLWVWAVLEMGLAGGVGSLAVVGAWAWWNGFGFM